MTTEVGVLRRSRNVDRGSTRMTSRFIALPPPDLTRSPEVQGQHRALEMVSAVAESFHRGPRGCLGRLERLAEKALAVQAVAGAGRRSEVRTNRDHCVAPYSRSLSWETTNGWCAWCRPDTRGRPQRR